MNKPQDPIDEPQDPLEACAAWLEANGFADVIECEPEDVDLERLHQGLAAYHAAQFAPAQEAAA